MNTLELPRDAAGKTAEDYYNELSAIGGVTRYRVMSAAQFLADDSIPFDTSGANDMIVEHIAPPPPRLSRHIADICANPTQVNWLHRDELERNVIAVLSGPRGVGKTAKAEDWEMRTALLGLPVLVLTAEGTGTDRHVQGWLNKFAPNVDANTLPLRVVEHRIDLNSKEGRQLVYDELAAMRDEFGQNPALCCIDTYSKYSGALKHNDNSEVSAFVGGLDRAIRRPFGCTVLLVAHTGLSDTTRARGASSLEADTDAAYVLTKDRGIVSLTRERFKDSPEMEPLKYKLEVVDLGRVDEDGESVTTRVLVPTDAPVYQPKAKAITTVNQKLALAAVNELSVQGAPVEISRVIDLALSRKAKDSKGRPSDLRRYIREALDAIALARHVWINGEQCGSGALQPSEWLEA